MQKRGIGHVEAILSFILFIGFVSTSLFFFLPSGGEQIIDSTLYATVNSILANTTADFESYSIKILEPGMRTIAIEFPPEIAFLNPAYRVRAETYEGETLPATRDGNMVYVDPNGREFLILKFSEDLQPGPGAAERPDENSAYYTVSSSSKRKVVSEQKIRALNSSYYNSYESTKESLGIPSSISYGFSFALPDFMVVAERNVPEGLEVFSTLSRRELLLQTDGALVFGEVSIRVW